MYLAGLSNPWNIIELPSDEIHTTYTEYLSFILCFLNSFDDVVISLISAFNRNYNYKLFLFKTVYVKPTLHGKDI